MKQFTPLLDRMSGHRIFSLRWELHKFVITEANQRYNSVDMTPMDLIRLGTEMVAEGTARLNKE